MKSRQRIRKLVPVLDAIYAFIEVARVNISPITKRDQGRIVATIRLLMGASPRGKKKSERYNLAYEDWNTGMRKTALFRRHIKGHDNLSYPNRQKAEKTLVSALDKRQKRERLRAAFVAWTLGIRGHALAALFVPGFDELRPLKKEVATEKLIEEVQAEQRRRQRERRLKRRKIKETAEKLES